MTAPAILPERGLGDWLSALFWRKPPVLLFLLIAPQLLWLGVVYIGSLLALLLQTFRTVILPLALSGVIAGSIFTFSLTMGDYIIPQINGTSARYIGLAVYQLQGTAGNLRLAAAFAVVPIVIMLIYLAIAKRMGAFDAL